MQLPDLALSVRQPWAWAIIHAGKDIENRSWQAINRGLLMRGRVCVHAAKGMTRSEYEDAADFMASIGVECPPPAELLRGGIIGVVDVVDVVDVVKQHESPWFFGPRGLVLESARAVPFVPAVGALGYFRWSPGDASIVPAPAKWMRPASNSQEQGGLL
ncbi:hypothetical protein GH266_05055 [Stappia indica]|uniref:ASCH domain-containing protein n=2 Tax=Stappia indica TaxID=538381 RepID=A0A857CDS6_9HYPH|nr:hypothetical protein GH266_05055 [Stappia indica]